jgi:hypothetical protein
VGIAILGVLVGGDALDLPWILVSSWARMGRAKIRAIRTDDANHGILLSVSLDINPETTKNRNGA